MFGCLDVFRARKEITKPAHNYKIAEEPPLSHLSILLWCVAPNEGMICNLYDP